MMFSFCSGCLDSTISLATPKQSGNSLVEYVLPVAIIGVLLFSTLSFFPGLMKNNLNRSVGDSALTLNNQNSELSIRQWGKNPNLQSIQLTLQDGSVITLDNYPMDLAQALEVDGTNGTTDLLANQILQLAQLLKDKGEISEAEFNQFSGLANQGHRLASIQRLLEEAAANANGDKTKFVNSLIPFEGRDYRPTTLAHSIGLVDGLNPEGLEGIPVSTLSPFIRDSFLLNQTHSDTLFSRNIMEVLTRYESLSKIPALQNNPAAALMLQNLTIQIFSINGDFAGQAYNSGHPTMSLNPSELAQQMTSLASDRNALHICNMGQGQDSGIHCPNYKG